MGVKFHAMRDSDYNKLGPAVCSSLSLDGYVAMDRSFTQNFCNTSIERSTADAHSRQIIKLSAPTFNYVLSRGSGATLLQKVLRVSSSDWKEILNFDSVYDLNKNCLISINDATASGNYLYGPEIAEKFIRDLDIDKAIEDTLVGALGVSMKDSAPVHDIFTVDKNKDGVYMTAGYYAHYDMDVVNTYLKRGADANNIVGAALDYLFDNADSRLTYLLNMNRDKSGLYGMLNYYIAVIPSEMRPKIDNAEHKLTKMYTAVITADYNLRTIKGAHAQPKDIAIKYKNLDRATSRLQYKNDAANAAKDDLSILERVKSKKGYIRMNNLGKRQDYSGRAVVCINPFLPLDTIRVPKSMLPKLLEYHILPYLAKNLKHNNELSPEQKDTTQNIYDKLRLSNLDDAESRSEMIRIINEHKLLKEIPFVLGRQPTLHKQSLQAFNVEISDFQAIEVNPLVCPAFNMDFDGDAAHLEVPLSPAAIKEVRDLIMTTQNLYLAKTGEVTTVPRQDMIYGLYVCTRDKYKLGEHMVNKVFNSLQSVRYAVMNHEIKVWDTVKVANPPLTCIAGDAAFMSCFPEGDVTPRGTSITGKLAVKEITSKTITPYIEHLLRRDSYGNNVHKIGTGVSTKETVVGAINRLVELGFKVARIYTPNVSILPKNNSVPEYDNALPNFHNAMSEADFYYDLGLDTSDNYKLEFNKNKDILDNTVKKHIIEKLGEDNGYVALSQSGARGSKDNLTQMFTCKGQVKKNSTEAFDALIDNSYVSQLTPTEQFVAAYGGRQGQIDKSLKTGDTGYAMRQMWHATQGYKITVDDCGTKEGFKISKKSLTRFVDIESATDENEKAKLIQDVNDMFKHAIVGRYTLDNQLISEELANKWATEKEEVTIRSPLYCQCPCCQKCYGVDWSTHKPAVKSLAVGVISAQSIGEPGTQLTMKQFQKGGVAGKAEMTSAFDKVNNYILCTNIAKQCKEGKYPGYDPLAWDDGEVHVMPTSDINRVKVTIGENKKKNVIVPKSVALKNYATKGEGLSYKHGDYDLHELLDICGINATQEYLVFKLYNLYKSEVEIALVHFEILVASMTRYMIYDTDRDDIMIGQYCTGAELFSKSVKNTKYKPNLISVNMLVNTSMDAMDAIIMERQGSGLARLCLLELQDKLVKPINRIVMGLPILEGSARPGFIEERKEIIT